MNRAHVMMAGTRSNITGRLWPLERPERAICGRPRALTRPAADGAAGICAECAAALERLSRPLVREAARSVRGGAR